MKSVDCGGYRQRPVGIRQLTGRPVDRSSKLISAGFARPHVSNAVIGKVLRPFWLDQIRTTLRALIHWYTYSWIFICDRQRQERGHKQV
jgi:hypothetical protein